MKDNDTRTGPDGDPGADTALSRRRLLGTVGAAGATGLALGATAGVAGAAATREEPPTDLATVGSTAEDFHGKHQSGIVTRQQAAGQLVAFDLEAAAGRKQAAALLRRWSRAAERLMSGERPDGDHSGVALDAGPSSLTVTFGFGHSFFRRTGLESQRPEALRPLPQFSADALDKDRSEGDLWVQIGADDGLVAFHALRTLQREAVGTARVRWQMSGFNRSVGATTEPMTQRNLMGQVDGTNNPKPSEDDFDKRIFVTPGGPPEWMEHGSYAVLRRIRMLLDRWDKQSLAEQEKVIGRRKSDGAPLSGGGENTPVDLTARTKDGGLAIAEDAHVRITPPEANHGAAMLRRPFSYHDGLLADGAPDAGLLFIAWQADPMTGFVPVQRRLDSGDALSSFIRHEASGLFAVPGGAGKGEYVGQRLLEA